MNNFKEPIKKVIIKKIKKERFWETFDKYLHFILF